jgi:hypothetical protein
MVKKYGNYEVNSAKNWIRFKFGDDDYEYVIEEKMFEGPEQAKIATNAFVKGYLASKEETRRLFKELIS